MIRTGRRVEIEAFAVRFKLTATPPFLTYPPVQLADAADSFWRKVYKSMKTNHPPVRHHPSANSADCPIRQSATTL